jgi:sugar lactone lactonase YvrE
MQRIQIVSTMVLCMACAPCFGAPFLSKQDTAFLEDLAAAVLDASRVLPEASVGEIGPNTTGATLIRPGGRNAYPAFWIRDYAMSLDAAIITPEEQRHALRLTAEHQVDATVVLPTESVLPPGSIADHISFGGAPIFFPGVLEDWAAQGGERWGLLPCLDDHFYFIHMAHAYVAQTGDTTPLQEVIRGKTVLQRLEAAYAVPPSRPETSLVYATEAARGVNFGFFDTTVHTGDLLFASVLKYRAARELSELLAKTPERAAFYQEEMKRLRTAIVKTFALKDGFLRASTGVSAQHDVWGTAFAVYVDALPEPARNKACIALADALRRGVIAWKGAIRHVPTDQDFSAETAWEKSYAGKNRYQNGAYWNTSTGWVAYAVAQNDPALAEALVQDYLAQIREDDFRKGDAFGSPWECMHEEDMHRQNPVYLTSVTAPLAAFRRIQVETMTVGDVRTVGEGYEFTEGPVWLGKDGLIFSDIPADTIYRADKSVFRRPSGNSNGLTLDQEGRLIAAEHGNRRVSRTEADGSITVVADRFEGKRLNSPNDVVVRSDGAVFFTDPPYGLEGGLEGPNAELDFCGVYAVLPDGSMKCLAKDFQRPNGITLSPDEKILYVADTRASHIRAFAVAPAGNAVELPLFCELPGPDGIKTDGKGNIWATSDGVWVFNPKGTLLQKITFPERPANCAFGEADGKTLYVTARNGVYAIQTKVAGLMAGKK